MTLREALEKATRDLARAAIPRAEIEARLLLGQVLGLSAVEIIARDQEPLSPSNAQHLLELILRRSRHEPFAYIAGCKEFMGLQFVVNRSVLIPRPETEQLVEETLNWIRSRKISRGLIIDLGTGSGCIALSLAHQLPRDFRIVGIDRSSAAIETAKENARRLNLAHVEFKVLDFLQEADEIQRISRDPERDAVIWISNPPYIPSKKVENLDADIRDFEPRDALDGGADGLVAMRALFKMAERSPRGLRLLGVEAMDQEQLEEIRSLVPRLGVSFSHGPHFFLEQKPWIA